LCVLARQNACVIVDRLMFPQQLCVVTERVPEYSIHPQSRRTRSGLSNSEGLLFCTETLSFVFRFGFGLTWVWQWDGDITYADTLGVLVDMDTHSLYFFKNGICGGTYISLSLSLSLPPSLSLSFPLLHSQT